MDTRRIVVLDATNDARYENALSGREWRERIADAIRHNDQVYDGNYWSGADAVLAVLLGTDPEEAPRGE